MIRLKNLHFKILYAISAAFLSFTFLTTYVRKGDVVNAFYIFAFVLLITLSSFILSLFFYDKIIKYGVFKNKYLVILSFIIAIIASYYRYISLSESVKNFLYSLLIGKVFIIDIITYIIFIFQTFILALYYYIMLDIIIFVCYKMIICKIDKFELYISLLFFVVMCILAIFIHNHTSAFDFGKGYDNVGNVVSTQYDAILDCDSVFITNWPHTFSYNNIRHPFFSDISIIDYIIAKPLSFFFKFKNQMIATIFSILNILRLAFSGLILKRLTKSKFSLVLYYISFSTILFSIVLETHTYMIFWLLITIYLCCIDDENIVNRYMSCFYAFSANYIAISIAPLIIKAKSIKQYFINGFIALLSFFYYIIVLGRLPSFLYSTITETKNGHIKRAGFIEAINRYSSFIKDGICDVKISIHDWSSGYIENSFSIIGILILLICIIVFIKCFSNKYIKFCFFWIVISILIFPIIGFSYYSYSTHSVLFTWAFISLSSIFLMKFFKKSKIIFLLFSIIILFICITNFVSFSELYKYSLRFNYLF